MNNYEGLKEEAKKFVRLKALQQIIPDINQRKKQPYIDRLAAENSEKLKNLVNFWKINRYRNLYLYRYSMDETPSPELIIQRLNGVDTESDENEPIYEILRTNYDPDLNDLYVFLKMRSVKKHFKSERPVSPFIPINLDHRKPRYLNSIYHMDDNILECRTYSKNKAEEVSQFFVNQVFYEEKPTCEKIIIYNKQLNSVSNNSKCTELLINGEYFGANQIRIIGSDTLRCLGEFKRKEIDFNNIDGLEVIKNKNVVEDLYIRTNSGNGKIQIIKIVEETLDPYRYIKNLVGL